jgi:hypothetical protein
MFLDITDTFLALNLYAGTVLKSVTESDTESETESETKSDSDPDCANGCSNKDLDVVESRSNKEGGTGNMARLKGKLKNRRKQQFDKVLN